MLVVVSTLPVLLEYLVLDVICGIKKLLVDSSKTGFKAVLLLSENKKPLIPLVNATG